MQFSNRQNYEQKVHIQGLKVRPWAPKINKMDPQTRTLCLKLPLF